MRPGFLTQQPSGPSPRDYVMLYKYQIFSHWFYAAKSMTQESCGVSLCLLPGA